MDKILRFRLMTGGRVCIGQWVAHERDSFKLDLSMPPELWKQGGFVLGGQVMCATRYLSFFCENKRIWREDVPKDVLS